MSKKEKKKDYSNLVLIFLGLVPLVLTVYVGHRIYTSEKNLISISVLAIIAGLIYEAKRLSQNWYEIFLKLGFAYFFSFIVFGKGKGSQTFDDKIALWPYFFIGFFIMIAISFHREKIISKLTEGITLLQSLAFVYWISAYNLININNVIIRLFILIGLGLSAYSAYHAFTYKALSRNSRFVLSIWSSVVMLVFAIEYIFKIYQSGQIENAADLTSGLYIALQYFLLGVSCIYIVQNTTMLLGFLPGKDSFFNKQLYKEEVQKLKDDHIDRYIDTQVKIKDSFFCVLFVGTIFYFNYIYEILPANTAIWAVFVIFPYVLWLYDAAANRKNDTKS